MSDAAFRAELASWHDFYMLAGTAAATLLGLLFVSVSLNLKIFSDPRHPDLRARAVNSFASFIYLIIFALIVMIPDASPDGVAWPLLIITVLRLVDVQREVARARRQLRRGWLQAYLVSLTMTISYAVVIVMSAGVLLGYPRMLSFDWLVAVIATLLASGGVNAWDLLVRAGDDTLAVDTETDAEDVPAGEHR